MITTQAATIADLQESWHPPARARAGGATAWRDERRVFASEELGWLGDEARRWLHRQSGLVGGCQILRDVHRDAQGFALLAAHPRLLARAAALLDGPVTIAGAMVHCGSLVRPGVPTRGGSAIIVVPLARRAEAPLGDISLGARPDRLARYAWPFVAVYRRRRDADARPPALADDCLWPPAAVVAG